MGLSTIFCKFTAISLDVLSTSISYIHFIKSEEVILQHIEWWLLINILVNIVKVGSAVASINIIFILLCIETKT